MTSEAPRRVRLRHVTTTGTALAGALLPLVVGVLLAKAMAADPMTPVNALITNGGRARIPQGELRRRGGTALRTLKARRVRGRSGPVSRRRPTAGGVPRPGRRPTWAAGRPSRERADGGT
ncbi:hypothetical protein GCM10023237_58800 [Streptomyces coeruleoprunus]|uniref:hypothetical protein n=1 Tax=Streptomyces coeruleoprunus TaxID=285563 RepID=UPI0031E77D77